MIVALEWEPDAGDRRDLAWAFRQASDYLYDVSDGVLAFGQVVIGGPALADAADIIVAASTRVQGRSWVGGIHLRQKKMPIRIGRGEWRRGLAIPWDEPEGYRVIVHEWAHYALHLKDAYLSRIDFANRPIQIPNPYLVGSSVMETLDGVSELSLHVEGPELYTERELLQHLYPSSRYPRPAAGGAGQAGGANPGPGRLRMPLPHVVFAMPQSVPGERRLVSAAQAPFVSLGLSAAPASDGKGGETPYDRCWLYVLDAASAPPRLIAQGTLERRSGREPFRIIGAQAGSLFVAIIRPAERRGRDLDQLDRPGGRGAIGLQEGRDPSAQRRRRAGAPWVRVHDVQGPGAPRRRAAAGCDLALPAARRDIRSDAGRRRLRQQWHV